MATVGSLVVNVTANTGGLVRGLTQSRSLLGSFALSGAGATAALAALAATAAAMVNTYEQLNKAMTRSLAIMGDVSEEMRGKMVESALEVSRTTQFSAKQAAEAYFFLASAGMSAEDSLKALPIVANFAQAGNFDLATATTLAADAQSALGMKSKDTTENLRNMTKVTDVLVKANVLANANVQQFSEALTTKAGAALKTVNKDIEEGVAVLAAFADQGVKGADAGTALHMVMRDLQTQAIKNADRFKAAGVSVFDATGDMRNMADVVGDLEHLLGGLSDEQKKATLMTLGFSDKSVGFVQALVGSSDKIREYETQLRAAGGTAKEVAGKSLTDLEKSLNSLRSSWERLSVATGGALEKAGAFRGLSEGMEGVAIMMERATKTGGAAGKKRDLLETVTNAGSSGEPALDVRLWGKLFDRLGLMPTGSEGIKGHEQSWLPGGANYKKAMADQAAEQARADNPATPLFDAFDKFTGQLGDVMKNIPSRVDQTSLGATSMFGDLKSSAMQAQVAHSLDFFGNAQKLDQQMAAQREAQKKADEAAKVQADAIASQVDAITKSVQTPAERARDALQPAMDLFSQGKLGEDVLQKVIAQQAELGRGPSRHLGVIEKGSREAFDFKRGRGDSDPMNSIAKDAKEQLAVLKAIRDNLDPTKNKPAGFTGDINVSTTTIA